jgi:hypothetical protein
VTQAPIEALDRLRSTPALAAPLKDAADDFAGALAQKPC